MANETSLVLMIVLPFVGSVLATAVPSNGRNREFWLAGSAALAVLVLAAASFIYVALADLIPQLQKRLGARETLAQIAWLLVGIGLVSLVSFWMHVH
jgi:zinc transporter ZupT